MVIAVLECTAVAVAAASMVLAPYDSGPLWQASRCCPKTLSQDRVRYCQDYERLTDQLWGVNFVATLQILHTGTNSQQLLYPG